MMHRNTFERWITTPCRKEVDEQKVTQKFPWNDLAVAPCKSDFIPFPPQNFQLSLSFAFFLLAIINMLVKRIMSHFKTLFLLNIYRLLFSSVSPKSFKRSFSLAVDSFLSLLLLCYPLWFFKLGYFQFRLLIKAQYSTIFFLYSL